MLKNYQAILFEDIDKINLIYAGNGSSLISSKYKERAKNLTHIISYCDNICVYMKKISCGYQSNIDESMKNFGQKHETFVKDGELYV